MKTEHAEQKFWLQVGQSQGLKKAVDHLIEAAKEKHALARHDEANALIEAAAILLQRVSEGMTKAEAIE